MVIAPKDGGEDISLRRHDDADTAKVFQFDSIALHFSTSPIPMMLAAVVAGVGR